MSQNRRVLAYVAIALIVGAALALAAAVASSGAAGTSADSAAGSASPSVAGLSSDDAGTDSLAAADPAKERPALDKFKSKDPFIQFPKATSGSTDTGTTGTSSDQGTTNTSTTSNRSAKVKVDGTSYNVTQGEKVPGGSAAAFTVSSVSSDAVTFAVIDGALQNGDKTFAVSLGEEVKVTLESDVSYDIAVVSIGSDGSSSGNSSSSSSSKGHSISVLSINSQDGVGTATFEVDGKTYSDKKQGDVFSTSWGEIEVLSISVGSQSVTVRHGDQTLNLSAGQVVVK